MIAILGIEVENICKLSVGHDFQFQSSIVHYMKTPSQKISATPPSCE